MASVGQPTESPVYTDRVSSDLETMVKPVVFDRDPIRDKRLTVTFDGLASDVVKLLSFHGLNVILDSRLKSSVIQARFVDEPIERILKHLATVGGKAYRVLQRDGHVFIGEPSDSDLAVQVFFLSVGEASVWRSAYMVAGGSVDVEAVDDMLIVRGSVDQLSRVEAFHNSISGSRRQYMLDVVFAELTNEQSRELGIEFTLDGLASVGLSGINPLSTSKGLEMLLSGVLRGSGEKTQGASWWSTRLLVVEGKEASLQVGDNISIRQRATSDNGFVEDTGVQTFQTGMILSAVCYGLPSGLIRLDVKPELSSVKEFIEGVPTISTRQFTSSCYVGMGGVVVLGGLSRMSGSDAGSLFPGTGIPTRNAVRDSRGRMFVFLRVKEISAMNSVAFQKLRELRLKSNFKKGLTAGRERAAEAAMREKDQNCRDAYSAGLIAAQSGGGQVIEDQTLNEFLEQKGNFISGIDDAELDEAELDEADIDAAELDDADADNAEWDEAAEDDE